MKLFSRKKGALELSVNAIVIIVLAMTLLGLGLTFIRGQFRQFTETTITVQEQVRQQIMDDLRVGNKKLSFPSDRFNLGVGEKKDLAIGVKNTGDSELTFVIKIQERIVEGETASFNDKTPETKTDGGFFWDNSEQTLGVGEARVYGILYQGEDTQDTYLYKLVLEDVGEGVANGTEYDSKSFFVSIV